MTKPKNVSAKPVSKQLPTKRAQLITLLQRKAGATLDELASATCWQRHTTSAVLTSLRKSGFTIESEKVDGVRRYRIVEAAA